MQFHEKLVHLRKEHHLSQEDIAFQLNVSRQAVSKWENGQAYPDYQNLIALSDLYNISIDHLIREQENNTNKNALNVGATTFDKAKSKNFDKIKGIVLFITIAISLLTFLLTGILGNFWHIGWLVFFSIPIIATLFEAIEKRKASEFGGFIFICLGIYLFIGIEFHIWHPSWIVFTFIPIYYIICGIIENLISTE